MSATTEFGTIEERVNRVVEVSHCSFLRYFKTIYFQNLNEDSNFLFNNQIFSGFTTSGQFR